VLVCVVCGCVGVFRGGGVAWSPGSLPIAGCIGIMCARWARLVFLFGAAGLWVVIEWGFGWVWLGY